MATREHMIAMLVDDWKDTTEQCRWVEVLDLLTRGFVGYDNMTDEQLDKEYMNMLPDDYRDDDASSCQEYGVGLDKR